VRNIYLIILFFSFSFAVVTVSPDGTQDFTTIQAAIDSVTTNPVDIEIDVYPGTYQENLLIEADMIIRSVGDTSNTIIDGSLGNRSLGSTIVIRPESNTTHHPVVEIDGFSIKNGKGTEVVNNTITLPDGTHPTEKVGGGLFVYVNSPKINNSQFLDNGNNSTDKGGAVFAASGGDDIGFPDRDHYQDHADLEPATGPLDFSNNTFIGNNSREAKSVFISGFVNASIILDNGFFDVYGYGSSLVTKYWVKALESNISLFNGEGLVAGIEDRNIYVSSENGNDIECSGIEDCPFRSLNHALALAIPNEQTPNDIIIASGTYAQYSTQEQFPLQTIDYVDLIAPNGAVIDGTPEPGAEDDLSGGIQTLLLDAINVELINLINTPPWSATTAQAFYLFFEVLINNQVLSGEDSWIAAFKCLDWNNNYSECYEIGLCVGAISWGTSGCDNSYCTIPTMGYDGNYYSEGSLQLGDIPLFLLYDPNIGIVKGYTDEIVGAFTFNAFYIQDKLIACTGQYTYNFETGDCELIINGDINFDELVNILDVVALVNIVLNSGEYNTAGDLNSDGVNNILDVVALVNIILNG